MSCALDSTVIIELIGGDSATARRAEQALWTQRQHGALSICAAVYAECLAFPAWRQSDLDATLEQAEIQVDWTLTKDAWLSAARAFSVYAARRRSARQSHPRRILADFIIGAHALTVGALMTRNTRDFRRAFPRLRLVAPE